MRRKLVRPDAISMGLDVADDGALLDGQSVASNSLYALGPLRKGVLWESIAVPELRVQVAELANLLMKSARGESDSFLPAALLRIRAGRGHRKLESHA